jgi:thioesterase domain-containing protein
MTDTAEPPVSQSNNVTTQIRSLRRSETGPTLFCLYDLKFGHLVTALSPQVSLYGLDVDGLEVAPADFSIRQLAQKHLQDLRATQANGPYILLGYSFGGLVAYEMAVQLQQSGAAVALLVLFDTPHPGFLATLSPAELEVALRVYRTDRAQKYLNHLKSGRIDRLATDAASYLGKKLVPLGWSVLNKARRALGRNTPAKASPSLRTGAMWHAYTPPSLDGQLLLIRAQGRDAEFAGDPTMGWRKCALKGVDVQFATGSHETMMTQPHATQLAELLAPFVLAPSGSAESQRVG